jgi:HTH-type transcriptional regulator/antitoxin HipB
MTSLKKYLEEKLKDEEFKNIYEQELDFAKFSIRIHEERENRGLTQKQLSSIAGITQQQLSKIENGISCNVKTLIKACKALNLKLEIV